jgi:flagellar hook-associated protein 2
VATDLISSLGAGSGIDIRQLSTDLVESEKAPRQQLIQSKIDKSTAEITGYGGMMFVLTELKRTVAELDDAFDFSGLNVRNTQSSAFDVEASASASPGRHEITVSEVAKPQRSLTDFGFADRNSTVISGSDFTFTLTVGSEDPVTITVNANSTLEGVKDAINGADAGLTAQVIDSGVEGATDRYKIMVTGQPGASNAFTLTSSIPATIDFDTDNTTDDGDPASTLQLAQDASLVVDGISYTRGSNSISDIIPGVSLNLLSSTVGQSVVQLDRDTSSLKTKLQNLVTAYNDVQVLIDVATDPKSEDPDFGASLVGNSAVRSIQLKLREIILGTGSASESTTIRGLRDLGITLQDDGSLALNEATYDTASSAYYDEAVEMLSGRGLTNEYGDSADGIAVRANTFITEVISARGTLLQNSQNAERKVADYEQQLVVLEDRMASLFDRYMEQFSVMQSIVGQLTSMRTSLASTFEGLSQAYKK